MNMSKYQWWIRGIFYGTFMFLCLKILFALANGEELVVKELLIGFVFWMVIGLAFGYGIRSFESNNKKDKTSAS